MHIVLLLFLSWKALFTYFEKETYTKVVVLAILLISENTISFPYQRGFSPNKKKGWILTNIRPAQQ